jgi:hypothetical protein
MMMKIRKNECYSETKCIETETKEEKAKELKNGN